MTIAELESVISEHVVETAEVSPIVASAVDETLRQLDHGRIRVAEPREDEWVVNAWIQKAILLFFKIAQMKVHEVGPFRYHDKIPLKTDVLGVRVVPPATIRYGAFLESGVVMMPSYVNIGSFVGRGTMIDTWATVGSCAQIGRHVHLSGGVGIGGVLEPPGRQPVIVEDGAFVGSRCVVVEGVRVGKEAVLGANVVLTASTPIIDVTGAEPRTFSGVIPQRAVVIPGTRPKTFEAGSFGVPCALIIGRRSASTDRKTSLNQVLREFSVSV